MVYRVASVGGAEGFLPTSIQALLDELPHLPRERAIRLLRTFSVAYLIGSDARESPSLERISLSDPPPVFVYRIREPLPLARMVSRLTAVQSDAAAFDAIATESFAPEREAVVSALPNGWSDQADDHGGEAVAILSYHNDSIRLHSSSRAPGLMVLNEAFFPGWEATIDGVPAEIIRTNVLVRGVAVPAGEHAIDLDYRPRSLHWGLYISAASLLLATLGIARSFCVHRAIS
jgi:hypothetical protein